MYGKGALVLLVVLLGVERICGQCVDESPMPPTVPPTSWTAWYNVDDPTDGTDDETHAAVNAVHPAVCPTPTQANCRVRFLNTDHVTAGQTLVTGCSPTGGLLCQDADQTDSRRCLDYEIRFQCPTPEDALPEPHFHWDMSTKTSVDSDEPVTCDGTVSSIYPTAGGMTGIIGGTLLVTDSFDSSDHLCAVRNQKAGWINYGSGNDRCISEPVCCTSGFTMTFWMRNRTPAFTPVTIIIATGGHAGRARGLVLYLGDFMSFDVRGFVTSQVFKLNIKGYFPDDQWTHHSFTYEPGVGTNYYKDGVFVVSTDTAVNEGTSALHFDDVVMFSRNNDPSGWPLELIDGDFSNFKMFYKTFNETEVQNAYLQETSESNLLIHYLRKYSHEDSFGVELECLAKAGSQPTIVWHRSVDGAHFEPVSSSADVAIYESSPNSYRRRSILVARDLSFSSDVIFVCEAVDTARGGSVSKRVTIPKRDSYWTPWLSADSPADGDDRETLIQHQQGYEMLCQYPEDIQCRTVYEGTPSNETGQLLSINCTLTSGLECLGADQSVDNTRTCYDYEVRYQCPQPRFRWTPWYDASDPDGSVEDETLATHLKQAYPDLCSQPIGAECRLKTTKQDLLASGFVPEVPYLCNANGFRCQHADNTGSCPDFEVRYRCPDSIVTDVTVNLRPLHSPNDTVVRLECSATGGQPISADLRLEWAWLDLAHPWAAVVFTAGAAVDVVVDSSRPDLKSSLLTIVDFLCSDYSDKTIVCLARDGITIAVKTIQPLAKPPVPVLLEFWELSGEPNLDHQDPTSCSSVSNHSFPSTESDRKSQAVGRVTYIDAPAVVGHACAVLSGTDSALDVGAFDGECISSLELCSCGLTFALWVMAFDPGPLTFDWFFLSSRGWSSSSHGIAFYQSATDHSYRLKVCTSTKCFGEAIVANNEVPKGSWFHLALVFDHKLGLQVFINGNVSAESHSVTNEVKSDSQVNLVVGGANTSFGFSEAAFSDLRVYAGALTQSLIEDIMTCNSINVSFEITEVRQLHLPPGIPLIFECRARGRPNPILEWAFPDENVGSKVPSLAFEQTVTNVTECVTKSTLRVDVNPGNVNDELGVVLCLARFSRQELVKGVEVAMPRFVGNVTVKSTGDAVLGQTFHLLCRVSGDRIYSVDWYHRQLSSEDSTTLGELLVPTEGGKFNSTALATSTTTGEYRLIIFSFSADYYGTYTCSINRGLGIATVQVSSDLEETTASGTLARTASPEGHTPTVSFKQPGADDMPTTPAENRQTGTPEMVLLTDTSKAPSNRAAEMTMSLSPTGRITERYTDSLRLTSDPTTEEIRDGEVTTVTIETTMPAYESSSRPPDDLETLKPNIAEQPDDNGDDKELVDKPEQKKKSKLAWLVPVGVCLVLLGIPAAFVCHYICKKDNSVHALDRLMFKNKGVALPKPKLIKPRYQGATPMTPPKATPVSTPSEPMIRMVEVHKVSGPVDLAESIENNM